MEKYGLAIRDMKFKKTVLDGFAMFLMLIVSLVSWQAISMIIDAVNASESFSVVSVVLFLAYTIVILIIVWVIRKVFRVSSRKYKQWLEKISRGEVLHGLFRIIEKRDVIRTLDNDHIKVVYILLAQNIRTYETIKFYTSKAEYEAIQLHQVYTIEYLEGYEMPLHIQIYHQPY